MNATETTAATRIAFLRREASRDVDAEVQSGVDRTWLEGIVSAAAAELERLTYSPTPAERAERRMEEGRMRRGYRRASW